MIDNWSGTYPHERREHELRAELAAKDARIAELEHDLLYGHESGPIRKMRARAEQAEARLAVMREALEPFANMAEKFNERDAYHNDDKILVHAKHILTIGSFRKARAAVPVETKD
jgi:hypothetical protein